MKRRLLAILLASALAVLPMAGCAAAGTEQPEQTQTEDPTPQQQEQTSQSGEEQPQEVQLTLSDQQVLVDGEPASTDSSSPVYLGAQLVYYQDGQGEDYGEGTQEDAHTQEEAQAHTVVTITQPGTYRVSGTLSAGQLAVDLGENAQEDPSAVVELILDNAEITCTVAPAVIFYRVWESQSTQEAGAVVTLADGSQNKINGSYVARIYQEGTTDKLHKYDGAFYSKMSMLIQGEEQGDGLLEITAENEGLDTELHLTINGGNIRITAQNDGINTNEDGVSVTTVNGGYLYIDAGNGAEGDGIDSNGSLTINGGTVIALANSRSGDGGLDADGEIQINGGTVLATGSRNDAVSANSSQGYLELSYQQLQQAGTLLRLETGDGEEVLTFAPSKDYQSVILSTPQLEDGEYRLYSGGSIQGAAQTDGLYQAGGSYTGGQLQQYTGSAGGMGGGPGGMGGRPQGEDPQGEPPSGEEGSRPGQPPETEDGQPPQPPEGEGRRDEPVPGQSGQNGGDSATGSQPSTVLTISQGSGSFGSVTAAE